MEAQILSEAPLSLALLIVLGRPGFANVLSTIKEVFYEIMFHKQVYDSLETLQTDLDQWVTSYNTERVHSRIIYCGRTPIHTLRGSHTLFEEKDGSTNPTATIS